MDKAPVIPLRPEAPAISNPTLPPDLEALANALLEVISAQGYLAKAMEQFNADIDPRVTKNLRRVSLHNQQALTACVRLLGGKPA